jgi:hypothetical protein
MWMLKALGNVGGRLARLARVDPRWATLAARDMWD